MRAPRLSRDILPPRSDQRLARHSRIAGAGLVLILLAVSGFAVVSSQATSAAAHSAVHASKLSDDFATAATAVAGEESLERKYRLEPGPEVRARYDMTAASFVDALGEVPARRRRRRPCLRRHHARPAP